MEIILVEEVIDRFKVWLSVENSARFAVRTFPVFAGSVSRKFHRELGMDGLRHLESFLEFCVGYGVEIWSENSEEEPVGAKRLVLMREEAEPSKGVPTEQGWYRFRALDRSEYTKVFVFEFDGKLLFLDPEHNKGSVAKTSSVHWGGKIS